MNDEPELFLPYLDRLVDRLEQVRSAISRYEQERRRAGRPSKLPRRLANRPLESDWRSATEYGVFPPDGEDALWIAAHAHSIRIKAGRHNADPVHVAVTLLETLVDSREEVACAIGNFDQGRKANRPLTFTLENQSLTSQELHALLDELIANLTALDTRIRASVELHAGETDNAGEAKPSRALETRIGAGVESQTGETDGAGDAKPSRRLEVHASNRVARTAAKSLPLSENEHQILLTLIHAKGAFVLARNLLRSRRYTEKHVQEVMATLRERDPFNKLISSKGGRNGGYCIDVIAAGYSVEILKW